MYLHLGNDITVKEEDIVGIFDIETTSIGSGGIGGATRRFLARAEREGNVISVSYELPKSFILCHRDGKDTVYITDISSATLRKRNKPFDDNDDI